MVACSSGPTSAVITAAPAEAGMANGVARTPPVDPMSGERLAWADSCSYVAVNKLGIYARAGSSELDEKALAVRDK